MSFSQCNTLFRLRCDGVNNEAQQALQQSPRVLPRPVDIPNDICAVLSINQPSGSVLVPYRVDAASVALVV
ncbi:hypothetical protein ZHAS_00011180 [Anopheles sinensis]|uniref:Uncharacterized protein n=1 Tax=Anopheles sinensis TaxID=74873 RepID=A0A084VZJ1_ANOSI|nr:hypothetical protein ZHAS_00011180 [Anopheles sinensis]